MKNIFLSSFVILCVMVNTVGATELTSAQSLAASGVITISDDYRLQDTITRKEMMKIVMNLSGKEVPAMCGGMFVDVENDWGCKYIEEALSQGFIAFNDNFRPDETITKSESMKLILKARGIEKTQNTEDWQSDYMKTAYAKGLIAQEYSDHNAEATRGWIFSVSASEIYSGTQNKSVNGETTEPSPETVKTTEQIGVYTDYNASLVGSSDTTVLFFYASWCPSCQAADAAISGDDVVSSGITLLKTDYDSQLDLRKKYGVTMQHTFVQIDSNGELINKWTGSHSLADIQIRIQ
ncbi:S-layer homology domain-containing protein [Candidatus Gracilibacteria bacterium]|nr:S-layer homology domain-containing protein [Candidatus Gracilibacteria bacterium]